MDMTPATSDTVPLLATFFSVCMLAVSTAVAFTVFVLNLHYTTPELASMSPLVNKMVEPKKK